MPLLDCDPIPIPTPMAGERWGHSLHGRTLPERVAIIPCANYEDGEVQDAVEEAVLLLGGWEALIDLHDTVYVKPNLAGPFHPERAVTTHPAVVRALVRSLRQRGTPRVLVGDSPAGPSNASYQRILYKRTGMEAMAKETGISLDSDTSPVEVRIKDSRILGHATSEPEHCFT